MEGIDLQDIVVHPDGPENGWNAVLVLDGRPIADIFGDGVSVFSVKQLRDGVTDADVSSLDAAIRATGDPIATTVGERHETLADRVADIVATHWVASSVADLLSKGAVGTISADGVTSMIRVPVPTGGSLEDAIAYLADAHPDAVVLNRLEPQDAVLRYVQALPA